MYPLYTINRPISILPHLSILFEFTVYLCIQRSLNYKFVNNQRGQANPLLQLTSTLSFTNNIFQSFENIWLVDGHQAFNAVYYRFLILSILVTLGIGGIQLSRLQSYLTSQKKIVTVHAGTSNTFALPSSIPLWGYLSSFLFTNSFSYFKVILYSDKFKFYTIISFFFQHSSANCPYYLFNCVICVGLTLNLKKCYLVSLFRNHYLNFSLVRFILEYSVVLYHSYLARHQLCIELAQNQFLSLSAYFFLKETHPLITTLLFALLQVFLSLTLAVQSIPSQRHAPQLMLETSSHQSLTVDLLTLTH